MVYAVKTTDRKNEEFMEAISHLRPDEKAIQIWRYNLAQEREKLLKGLPKPRQMHKSNAIPQMLKDMKEGKAVNGWTVTTEPVILISTSPHYL